MLRNFLLSPRPFKLWGKCLFALLLFVSSVFPGLGQAPGWDWAQHIAGGGSGNTSTCYGAVADAAGNTYITGAFMGTGQFGSFTLTSFSQTSQLYVAKINAAGVYQWARTIGNYGRCEGQSVALDAAGNVYVTGNYDGRPAFGATTLPNAVGNFDVFVAKLNSAGAWLWAVGGGGYGIDVGRAVAVGAGGQVVITGQIHSQATFGTTTLQATPGFADIFVAGLDGATGAWRWSRCAVGNASSNNYGWGVGLSASGEVYIAGSFINEAQFGATTLTAAGVNDVFVAKLSAAGAWLWATRAGGSQVDECRVMAVDAAGNAYITGWYGGPATFGSTVLGTGSKAYVAKLDAAGNWQWARQTTGANSVFGRGIALDAAAAQVFVTGNFRQTVGFGSYSLTAGGPFDQYVAALDAAGNWQWVQHASGADRIVVHGLAAGPAGSLYTWGYAVGNATFGRAQLTHPNPPAEQPHLARLAPGITTAVGAPAPRTASAWPCPAAPAEAVQISWEAAQPATGLILRDALGREVYRQALGNASGRAATFAAPAQPGWYQCEVVFAQAPSLLRSLIVQP